MPSDKEPFQSASAAQDRGGHLDAEFLQEAKRRSEIKENSSRSIGDTHRCKTGEEANTRTPGVHFLSFKAAIMSVDSTLLLHFIAKKKK